MLKDNRKLYLKNWAKTFIQDVRNYSNEGRRRSTPILIIILFLFSPLAVSASCDCPELTTDQAYDQVDVIFEGKMVGVETNWISGGWKFSFEVERSWKKQTNSFYVVNTGWKKDCGYIFEEGKSYLVYVRRKFTPKTDQCKGNLPLSEASEIIESLGESYSPGVSSQAGPLMMLVTLLAILGMVFLGFVVLRKKNR